MKNIYYSFLILIAFAFHLQEAKATTYTFTSFSAANWSTESKWTPSYPGTTIDADDEVIIFGLCRMNKNINLEGTLTVDWGNLRVNSGKTLEINGGSVTIEASLYIEGTLINGGTLTNNGTLSLKSGGVFQLNNNPVQWPEGTFNWNSGSTVRIDDDGVFDLSNALNIPSNRTLEIKEGRLIIGYEGNLTINGTLTLTHSDGDLYVYGDLYVDDGGTLTHSDGDLYVDVGNLYVEDGGNFTQSGGNLYVQDGATLEVDSVGALTQDGGTLVIHDQGNLAMYGTLTKNGGDLYVDNGGKLKIKSSGTLTQSSGSFEVNENGSLNTWGLLTINGNLLINEGTLKVLNGGTLNNLGTLTQGGSLTIFDGGEFTHNGIANIFGTLTNNGTVTVNSGKTLTIEVGGEFTHNDTINILGTLTNNGTFNNNGLLTGSGTIDGDASFTNPASGILSPGNSPGCLNFGTNFTNDGTLDIELDDGTACDDFDQIVVDGDATINDTINISFINNNEPNESTFTILTATGTLTVAQDITINWPPGYAGSHDICTTCNPQKLLVTILSPLPVELIYFRAELLSGNNVGLDWQTASEENNLGFEIQRSINSQDWETIDFVIGKGTSTLLSTYYFQDQYPVEGYNYYRLKQIDFDGASEYSEIRAVGIKQTALDITVFPNPTTDELHINLGQSSSPLSKNNRGSIQLFNSLGKSILTIDATENESILVLHLKDFPKGIYTLLINIDQEVYTKQIILQ